MPTLQVKLEQIIANSEGDPGAAARAVRTFLTDNPSALLAEELAKLSMAWQAVDEELMRRKKTLNSEEKREAAEALYRAVRDGEIPPGGLPDILADDARIT